MPTITKQQEPAVASQSGSGDSTEAPTSRRWPVLAVVAIAPTDGRVRCHHRQYWPCPRRRRLFGFAGTDRQWIITAYALAFGSLLLLGGRIGDRLGRKPVSSSAWPASPSRQRSAAPVGAVLAATLLTGRSAPDLAQSAADLHDSAD